MLAAIVLCLIFSKSHAQLNGEFWWLNAKLNNFREEPSQPRFENLSEFDTDESAKIVFREDSLINRKEEYDLNINKEVRRNASKAIKFEDKSEILWPNSVQDTNVTKYTNASEESNKNSSTVTTPYDSDEFEFKFPDNDNFLWQDTRFNKTDKSKSVNNNTNVYDQNKINNTHINKNDPSKINNTEENNPSRIQYIITKVPTKHYKDVLASQTESICTYMKKTECSIIKGTVYDSGESISKRPLFETRRICCVIPLPPKLISSKIYFYDNYKPVNRLKRSDKEDQINPSLKQRNNLMLHKFESQVHKSRTTTSKPRIQRVVTPSDKNVDPYWNIKQSKQFSSKYDYESDDYVEDYVLEIPQPGLVGLYSDHVPPKPGWPHTIVNIGPFGQIDSDEDGEALFGYTPPTIIDPRLKDRIGTSRPRVHGRPVKQSTISDERNYDIESQTISYQSNPDFQVLQGFKLLNLVRNQSRIFRNGKKTTTERVFEDGSNEHVLTASSFESDYGDRFFDKSQQVYKECGRGASRIYDNGKQVGETHKGAHPWLALVVLTRRIQSVLCYATIVHPRAAVTAGDCVYGRTSPGEITLIAGAWRLNEENREDWQKRMVSSELHSHYKPGELAHNLAILHWKRPVRLTEDIQPACLSDPHVGDVCKFFGWGGYDQAIRKQSRWQEAVVLAPQTCSERVTSKRVPKDAFCASVQSRGTVTGIGGPLVCTVSGRQSAAGVAVWRDHEVVLLPAHEWTPQAVADLQLL